MKTLITLALILSIVDAQAVAGTQSNWNFEVLLDDKKIGYHDFTVTKEGSSQIVETEAKFNVKILFVNVFNYRHQNTEVWQGNCLNSINAETDANGKDFLVRGQASSDEFIVQTAARPQELPSCIMTFAYWNPEFLSETSLLNSQTGEYEAVKISRSGVEDFKMGRQSIRAAKYTVQVKTGPITLWYAVDDKRWLGLESVVKGGRILRYQPVTLPAPSDSATAISG